MTAPVFAEPALQRHYQEYGYATFQALDEGEVRELRAGYDGLGVPDRFGIGYSVSLYSDERETRRRAHEMLVERAFPAFARTLVARVPYMSTFLVKEAGGREIAPHQDWTHCDESRHDALMAWIPLDDTDETNGGLGFVKGSHRLSDRVRPFPYQVAGTFADQYWEKLFPYLTILRLRAGEAVVFNNRIVHGSLPNDTGEPRAAFSFALHPAGEPLLCYYLKPNGRTDTVLRYTVDGDFYLEYHNPRMVELYHRRALIEGHRYEELPYAVDSAPWATLEERIIAAGNPHDPRIAARVQDLVAGRRQRP